MKLDIGKRSITLKQGDITKESVDAVVNAANRSLMGGGGVDGAIHMAGGPVILEECKKLDGCETGDAKITTAGNMPSKHVIHTVGPVWHGGQSGEDDLLASAYRRSLEVALENRLATVAFPSISTGAYGFPVDRAAGIALSVARDFLTQDTSLREVTFVLFDERTLSAFRDALEENGSERQLNFRKWQEKS